MDLSTNLMQYRTKDTKPPYSVVRMVLICVVVFFLSCVAIRCWGYEPGSVLVSRNADERENTSPGFWNHLAVQVDTTHLVESQEGRGVIRTPLSEFLARPYSQVVVLRPLNASEGTEAAARAERLVGLPHAPLSSLFPFNGPLRQKLGLNCVSVVEIAWKRSSINRPDRVFEVEGKFHPAETVR